MSLDEGLQDVDEGQIRGRISNNPDATANACSTVLEAVQRRGHQVQGPVGTGYQVKSPGSTVLTEVHTGNKEKYCTEGSTGGKSLYRAGKNLY